MLMYHVIYLLILFQDLKSISKFAHVFADVKSKILVLNRNYMELLPDLYSMEVCYKAYTDLWIITKSNL